jgi:hypothetical protein
VTNLVLGVDVDTELFDRWREWLAPAWQPFFVASRHRWPKTAPRDDPLSEELGHTYRTWRIDASLEVLWLDEVAFLDLPRSDRTRLLREQIRHGRGAVPSVRRWSDLVDPDLLRRQADGHRFVWWPTLVAGRPREILERVICSAPDGSAPASRPSRHHAVPDDTWHACAGILPAARRIAGTFPPSSGPNCFGTVLAAAGVADTDLAGVLQAPFLCWLESSGRRGGRDEDPGTVLVWRDPDGLPVHAAVTIGGGWAIEKASAEWWTPRAVRPAREVIRATRSPGLHLERHALRGRSS